jgi:hypothetical protein
VRILIDESLPRQLVPLLIGHDARMVQSEGWSSVKNGDLLRRAATAGFDVVVTPDRKLEYQQHMPRVGVAVIVLRARTNRLADIAPLVPALLDVLPEVRVGTVTHLGV